MPKEILIVEDLFIEAKNLEIIVQKAGYKVFGIAKSANEALQLITDRQPDLALVDIQLKGSVDGIELAGILREKNIGFVYVSANYDQQTLTNAKATHPFGFVVKPFRESDLLVTLEIAQYRHENSFEGALRKEEELKLSLQRVIGKAGSWQSKMLGIVGALQAFHSFDYLAVCTSEGRKAGQLISYLRVGFDEYQYIGFEEFLEITGVSAGEINALTSKDHFTPQRAVFSGDQFEQIRKKQGMIKLISDTFKLESLFLLPVTLEAGTDFNVAFFSRRPDAYNPGQFTLVDRLKNPLSQAMGEMLHVNPGAGSPKPVPERKSVSRAGDNGGAGFDDIVGKSHLLLNVFDHVTQVAPVDTSVLILGESGTGKEGIARSIHRLSKRRDQPFVKINCTALPFHLIESELFGHEKGAFTGAMEKRIGKFEQADKGTIFLDEIGDMPQELQAKLLRVLQEKEIERIGGKSPIKVDVRIIAATNRNLEKEVADGKFRLDLYYRLNVFPILLPPLHERKEDIPLLIDHFISVYNKKAGKNVQGISQRGLREAMNYHWPGNIRELENLVERAVVLSRDKELSGLAIAQTVHSETVSGNASNTAFKTIEEIEREHIMSALRQCKGKVWGTGGAAELLHLPASTLNSKIKKLGIRRDFI
jgi:DNA-binding NtrC family response regulator